MITKAVTPAEAVAAADRTDADKALDAGRKPAELLAVLRVGEGMRAAELFAGGGYTVELLARVVGPTGVRCHTCESPVLRSSAASTTRSGSRPA